MKRVVWATVMLLCVILPPLKAAEPITLQQASKNQLIKVSFVSTGKHTGKCLSVSVKNKSKKLIKILINPGLWLKNSNSGNQDMVVTDAQLITLQPGTTSSALVYAMCASASKATPENDQALTLHDNNNASLTGMARLVHKYKLQNSDGQNAIWVITDNKPLSSINYTDTAVANVLRRYAANVKNVKFEPDCNKARVEPKVVNMYLGFSISERKNISAFITDSAGVTIYTIWNNTPFTAGAHSLQVPVTLNNLKESEYKLIIESNNEKILERRFRK